MLKHPTSFPLPDSYALFDDEAARTTHLVRVISHHEGDQVLVAFPLKPGASGNRRLPKACLVNADPLTLDEIVETKQLESAIGALRSRPLNQLRNKAARQANDEAIAAAEERLAWLRNRDARSETRRLLLEKIGIREPKAA